MGILRDPTKPDPVRSAGPADRIIVVDNTSTDGSADLIRGRYRQVVLIENDSNPGFAARNNVGIRYLLELAEPGRIWFAGGSIGRFTLEARHETAAADLDGGPRPTEFVTGCCHSWAQSGPLVLYLAYRNRLLVAPGKPERSSTARWTACAERRRHEGRQPGPTA